MTASIQPITILAVGAVHSYLDAVRALPEFSGFDLNCHFFPAGAVDEQLRAGSKADIVITSAQAADTLIQEGYLSNNVASIGVVDLALARRASDPYCSLQDAEALRRLCLEADAIYLPDTTRSTAGRHIARVLDDLSIAASVASKLHQFNNGAATMKALAESNKTNPIGFTQRPEIIGVEGVTDGPPLPAPFNLSTHYVAVLSGRPGAQPNAQNFLSLICNPGLRPLRQHLGMEDSLTQRYPGI
jgi:molybdate transport system substrate-binding protein